MLEPMLAPDRENIWVCAEFEVALKYAWQDFTELRPIINIDSQQKEIHSLVSIAY